MPNVEGIGLEPASVAVTPDNGIAVDDHLRTTNADVSAAGDVRSGIAHVGMQVWHARGHSIPIRIRTAMLQDVDRASIDGQDEGFVKLHVGAGTDRILGATIVASRAGEMISDVAVAISAGTGLRDLARVLHTYPAQSEAIRMAAMAYGDGLPAA